MKSKIKNIPDADKEVLMEKLYQDYERKYKSLILDSDEKSLQAYSMLKEQGEAEQEALRLKEIEEKNWINIFFSIRRPRPDLNIDTNSE